MDETNTAFAMGQAVGGIAGCVAMITIPTLFVVSLIVGLVKKSKGWIIAAALSGLLLLGLVAVVLVVAVIGAREAVQASSERRAVNASEGRAILDMPGNWSALDLNNEDAALMVGNLLREEYLIVIAEPTTDFDVDLDGFTELASGLTVGAISGGSAGAPVPLEINGFPARRVEIEGSSEGVRVNYLVTYIEGAEHYYQVLAWTLPSKRGVAFPRFEQVVATFRER